MTSIHHVAVRTIDYQRFAAFNKDVFEAECPAECSNPSVVRIGKATIHVFEVDPLEPDERTSHIGHYAIELDSIERFAQARARLLACASTNGIGIDFSEHISLIFQDPDGFMAEVLVRKTDPWDPALPTVTADRIS